MSDYDTELWEATDGYMEDLDEYLEAMYGTPQVTADDERAREIVAEIMKEGGYR